MFVKDSKTVIEKRLKNGYLHDSEEEKENKVQRFSKNVLFCGLFSSELGQL
jgi:hypothetical protein